MVRLKLSKDARGIIIPEVMLQSQRSAVLVDLILDTGAAYTMISRSAVQVLGYNLKRPRKRISIATANGRIHVPVITIHKISIGDLTVKNVISLCHDIPEIIEVAGLLGLSFLKHFRTTIDYRTLTLRIH